MELNIGDLVEITLSDGSKDSGIIEIKSSSTTWYMGVPTTVAEYGVKTLSYKWLRFIKESNIKKLESKSYKAFCDCGAVKAALPYKPSGHAYYYILFKDNK